MITLITGQPGNGKTLYGLHSIEEIRAQTGRPVFYSGIELLDSGPIASKWERLGDIKEHVETRIIDGSPQQCFKLPPLSIVVIDEAQRVYRPRAQGAAVPVHVSALETHRHDGIDIYLFTQHPQLIDTAVRKLVGRHVNVVRRFGVESAKLYQWEECKDPTSSTDKRDALVTPFSYPKNVYGWYKSAEVHTVKKSLPWRKIAVLVVAVVIVLASSIGVAIKVKNIRAPQDKQLVSASGAPLSAPSLAEPSNPWSASLRAPRVPGVAASARYFDPVQRVVSQPRVVGCMSLVYGDGRIDCRCFTSQGSRIDMTVYQCLDHMRDGSFDPSRPERDVKAENIAYLNMVHPLAPAGSSSPGEPSQTMPKGAPSSNSKSF